MNAQQFFDDPAMHLPPDRLPGEDYPTLLKRLFDAYKAHYHHAPPADDGLSQSIADRRAEASNLADAILKAVGQCLAGRPDIAFRYLSKAFSKMQPTIEHLRLGYRFGHRAAEKGIEPADDPLQQLYRIRLSADPTAAPSTRREMFHIPFESRHLVARQRFSLPGVPCLYLGGSLYTCWLELGRPAFHTCYASRFEVSRSHEFRFLNLAARPQVAREWAIAWHYPNDFLAAQVTCWPLIAACSVRRMHGHAPFIAEYTIPQLLLQWVLSQKTYTGIAYATVHGPPSSAINPMFSANYVFPARSQPLDGHCVNLTDRFKLTEPFPWHVIEALMKSSSASFRISGYCSEQIRPTPNTTFRYHGTSFCNAESFLLTQPTGPVTP